MSRPDIPPARWTQIEAIVDEAIDLPPDEREALIRQACGEDEELRRSVEEWLAACDHPSLVPDAPAAVFAAPLLTTGASTAGEQGAELQQLGPYRIVRELGRGGMGTVYLAERVDGELDRQVAVKVMRRGTGNDASLRRRFRDERQILARLEHPHIATLIDGGVTPDGRLFFVMQYIDGTPIDRYCDEKRLTIPDKLRLFLDVCAAVQHAHAKQVVHRDLKPGNILVTSDGQARLLDFGIAKLLEPASPTGPMHTRTGERLLTPEYASPEQIRGEPVTPASDVHALGVLLHRLLTGRRPFTRSARTSYELERAILDEEPTQPSDAVTDPTERRRLRGDLDAIVLTALRKQPAHRYADAGALAEEVDRHLKGLPVRARGRAPAYRLRTFAGRHRRILAAAGVGMILGATALAMSSRRLVPDDTSVLAIGRITDYRDGAGPESAAPLADMLATNLARTQGLAVVSASRMNELVRLTAGATHEAYLRAARLAGATELLSGAIYSTPGGELRLDLQRLDIASGTILGAHSATGANLFALADSTTVALAKEIGLAPPPGSITDVTTRSLTAYGHYVEGLRLFQSGATAAADSAFRAALVADSTFAMAALYYARNSGYQWRFASASAADREQYEARYARALRLAEKASDRERLMIRASYEVFHLSLEMSAVAETLAVRYPQEIDGHLMVGVGLVTQGRLREAIPHFQRIMAMDSVSFSAGGEGCAGCVAIDAMIEVQVLLDSMAAAEREARRWLALQPASADARSRLVQMLDGAGRYDEAMDLLRAGPFAGNTQDSVIALAKHWIRAGELNTADSLLIHWLGRVERPARGPLLYFHTIVLRNQGRLHDALATAKRLTAATAGRTVDGAAPLSAMVEAQMLFELGRFREAADVFGQVGRWRPNAQATSVQATLRTQALSMMAASLHAAGDTSRLMALADSLEREGERTSMFRPRDQHHFVRGLLHEAEGNAVAAVDEFERALSVPASDFSRVNLALADIHLREDRSREAIAVLRPATRGWFLETTNLHSSLTEVHEHLAEAYETAGAHDSAAVHWERVARAWEHADSTFAGRRLAAVRQAAKARSPSR